MERLIGNRNFIVPKVKERRLFRAVFTVESSYLIPLTVFILVLLFGLCFFYHQRVYAIAADGEAALYALAENGRENDEEERALERLNTRIGDNPVSFGKLTGGTSLNRFEMTVKCEISGGKGDLAELFSSDCEIRVSRVNAAKTQMIKWMAEYMIKEEGK